MEITIYESQFLNDLYAPTYEAIRDIQSSVKYIRPNFLQEKALNYMDENIVRHILYSGRYGFVVIGAKDISKDLGNEIKDARYTWSILYSGYKYGDKELGDYVPNYIVFTRERMKPSNYKDWQELYDFSFSLREKYNQDFLFIQPPDKLPIYVGGDGQIIEGKNEPIHFENYILNCGPSDYSNRVRRGWFGEDFITDVLKFKKPK